MTVTPIPNLFGGSKKSMTNSHNLVEFRAGRMKQNGTTVSPIKNRKGLIYVHQNEEDGTIHFCWKDRTTKSVEIDLTVLPGEANFEKVTQCKTGRVFVLKFKEKHRRYFYWSQEPKADKDEEWVNKINEYINNPPKFQ